MELVRWTILCTCILPLELYNAQEVCGSNREGSRRFVHSRHTEPMRLASVALVYYLKRKRRPFAVLIGCL